MEKSMHLCVLRQCLTVNSSLLSPIYAVLYQLRSKILLLSWSSRIAWLLGGHENYWCSQLT